MQSIFTGRARPLLLVLLASALCLPGCGGGGEAPGPQGNVLGKIVARDGSTANLGGVRIEVVGDGTVVTSDAAGVFRLRVAANQSFRLKLSDPRHPDVEGEDVDEEADDTPDEVDVDADEIEVGELDEDELCEIEVEIENGEIIVVVVECADDDGDGEREREGHARLRPPEGVESEALGEIELECGRACCRLELEVEGLARGLYALIVVDGDTEASLGVFDTGAEGHGRLVVEACEGDELPFDVDSLAGLSGLLVLVEDADGNAVLRGEMPDVEADEEGEHDEDGEGEGEEGEGEGDDEREGEEGEGEERDDEREGER